MTPPATPTPVTAGTARVEGPGGAGGVIPSAPARPVTPTVVVLPCPHGPGCDPSEELIHDAYSHGPDGPTHTVCLVHDQDQAVA